MSVAWVVAAALGGYLAGIASTVAVAIAFEKREAKRQELDVRERELQIQESLGWDRAEP